MSKEDAIRQVLRNRQLASLGDAYVNFVYSLALSKVNGRPEGIKVSDRILAQAFKLAGLRQYLGTRVTRKDLANASESLLVDAYLRDLLTIEESVRILIQNPDGVTSGLVDLMKLAAERVGQKAPASHDN
jgi:hypothetical protein